MAASRKKSTGARRGRKISVKLHKGMPSVELTDKDKLGVRLDLNKRLAKKIKEVATGPISISLQGLDVDLRHNQSYGIVAGSTGCISNPGGPSC